MKNILHTIFSIPVFYNLMQKFFGVNRKKTLVRKHLALDQAQAVVLDLAGGTGLYKDLWPVTWPYICLDFDRVKLKAASANAYVVQADAAKIPFKSQSIDYIFCSSFSHHVPLEVLEAVMTESARVLKPEGSFIFIDAVLRQESWFNRLLWNIDRGEDPHTCDELQSLWKKYFSVNVCETFSIYYDYILLVGRKNT